MKPALVIALLLLFVKPVKAQSFSDFSFDQHGVVFRIDPRIELLNTLLFLIGNPDANPASISYKQEIMQAFYRYKTDSAVVLLLDALMHWRDLSSPVFFMLHFDENLNLLPNLDSSLIRKGGGIQKMERLASHIKKFSSSVGYPAFFNAHKDFYELILKNTHYNFREFDERRRLENYFGIKNRSYTIVLNLLEGDGNFGTYISSPAGNDLYAVISSSSHNGDLPSYTPSYFTYNLIYHEFSHSYVNHLVYKNASTLLQYADLFIPVRESMASQGYDNWLTVVHETIVRAITWRLSADKFGERIGFSNFYKFEMGRQFIYAEAVGEALSDYERNRKVYKNFPAFFPTLLTSFNNIRTADIERLQAQVKAYRSPAISSIPPPHKAKYDSTMVFIVSSHEKTKAAQDSVLHYATKYRALLTDKIKIILDDDALQTNLSNSDIIVFGTTRGNSFLRKYIDLLPLTITDSTVNAGKLLKGDRFQIVTSWIHPLNPQRQMIIHTAQQAADLQNYFYSRHKDGNNYWIAQNLVTMATGDFKRGGHVWYAE